MSKGWYDNRIEHSLASRGIKTKSLRAGAIGDVDDYNVPEINVLTDQAAQHFELDLGDIKEQEIENFNLEQELDKSLASSVANARKSIDDAKDDMKLVSKRRDAARSELKAQLNQIREDDSLSLPEKRRKQKELKLEFEDKFDEMKDVARRDLDEASIILEETEERKVIEDSRDLFDDDFQQTRNEAFQRQGKIQRLEGQIEEVKRMMDLKRLKKIEPRQLDHDLLRLSRDMEALVTDISNLKAEQKRATLEIKFRAKELRNNDLAEKAELNLDKIERRQKLRTQQQQDKIAMLNAKEGLLRQKLQTEDELSRKAAKLQKETLELQSRRAREEAARFRETVRIREEQTEAVAKAGQKTFLSDVGGFISARRESKAALATAEAESAAKVQEAKIATKKAETEVAASEQELFERKEALKDPEFLDKLRAFEDTITDIKNKELQGEAEARVKVLREKLRARSGAGTVEEIERLEFEIQKATGELKATQGKLRRSEDKEAETLSKHKGKAPGEPGSEGLIAGEEPSGISQGEEGPTDFTELLGSQDTETKKQFEIVQGGTSKHDPGPPPPEGSPSVISGNETDKKMDELLDAKVIEKTKEVLATQKRHKAEREAKATTKKSKGIGKGQSKTKRTRSKPSKKRPPKPRRR